MSQRPPVNRDLKAKAAALLQEQSIFMKGLTVDLDEETRAKLAKFGMENAFEDWTQTWQPDQQHNDQQPTTMMKKTTTSREEEEEDYVDTPDYLKVATGTATAQRSSALQRGMPRASKKYFQKNKLGGGDGGGGHGGGTKIQSAAPASKDLRQSIEQLLHKPPP